MKRSTRGFVSGFSVALLATGAWGVFGSGGGTILMPEGAYEAGFDRVVDMRFTSLGEVALERVMAAEAMEEARQQFHEGREEEALEGMAKAVDLAPGDAGMRIEYAGLLKSRGGRLFHGGHHGEGASLLESASYQAQVALGLCEGEPGLGSEAAACFVILGDLSFEAGRDARGAAELYRSALEADGQNTEARERLADARLVLDRLGERRVSGMTLR